MVHKIAFDERVVPPARVRLIRSFGSHGRASSADLLFAIYDDSTYIENAFIKTSLQEAALVALAELIASNALKQDRIDQFILRTGRRSLTKDVSSLLAEASDASFISSQVEKEVRRTEKKKAARNVLILGLIIFAVWITYVYGALGLATLSFVLLMFFILSTRTELA